MTHDTPSYNPVIRRLWPMDRDAVRAHFMRLDAETRRMRFAGTVGDDSVQKYAERVIGVDTLVVGAFIDGELRAIAELRGLLRVWSAAAEFAISVERDWQHAGIGDALFDHLLSLARNRGFGTLHMTCLVENIAMRHLAAKHDLQLRMLDGEVDGTLAPALPTPVTMGREIARESIGAYHAVRSWLHRMAAI